MTQSRISSKRDCAIVAHFKIRLTTVVNATDVQSLALLIRPNSRFNQGKRPAAGESIMCERQTPFPRDQCIRLHCENLRRCAFVVAFSRSSAIPQENLCYDCDLAGKNADLRSSHSCLSYVNCNPTSGKRIIGVTLVTLK